MGMMKLEIPHALDKDEAKKRVEALLGYWSKKYGVTSSWNGDAASFKGKAMGVTIDGNLTVAAGKIGGEATDPGMLLRGQAKKYLEKKFNTYLDKSKSIADISAGED